jgi:protein Mpv17
MAENPIMTKAATSATVYTIGDILAQKTEGKSLRELDRMRTVRSMLAGGIGHGPLSHFWYHLSDGIFTDYLGWTQWWSFIPKVVLDHTLWGPVWNNTYLLLLGSMKMDTAETIWGDMK